MTSDLIIQDERLCCACIQCGRPTWISLSQYSAMVSHLGSYFFRRYTGPVLCTQCINPLRQPFITGSHAYGTPRLDSDIDLVVYGSEYTLDKLFGQHDSMRQNTGKELYSDMMRSGCLYFGRLNLVFITDARLFDAWRAATEWLVRRRPVTREYACVVMKRFRAEVK